MKLYLSSYKLGDEPRKLSELFSANKKIAYIDNALDFSDDLERRENSRKNEMDELRKLGLVPEYIDLRKYFENNSALQGKIAKLGGVFVRGGNTFVLRVAFKLSGFDKIIKQIAKNSEEFVYAGYSAGCCVLQKSLKGIEFVDDPTAVQTSYGIQTVWEGLGLIDYVFVPHYKSDHSESAATDNEVAHYDKLGIKYKTLRDGEVVISEV